MPRADYHNIIRYPPPPPGREEEEEPKERNYFRVMCRLPFFSFLSVCVALIRQEEEEAVPFTRARDIGKRRKWLITLLFLGGPSFEFLVGGSNYCTTHGKSVVWRQKSHLKQKKNIHAFSNLTNFSKRVLIVMS